jgi:hypothetical protein
MGMRDFLERLVARTVEATAVRPRVASRYERGPWGERASGQPAAVETAHVDAPAAPSRPAASAEVRPPRDPERRHAVRDRTPTFDHAAAPAAVAGSPDTGVATPPPVEPARTSRTRDPSPDREPSRHEVVPAPPAPAAIVRPQPVRPATSSPAPHLARAARTRPMPSAAPDLVQVRIGRIDVRATVARPEHPAPASTRAPRARPLSLEAFLDGKRERS